ncbi:hypothetical protein AMC99_00774 [Altererythrobacter epoxidivorans]|uniref:Uncharacterized protein n=1 Tax=Altererythrobacter epoxidivorans TaxID=361183 RepID=A0A0M4M6S5_9SPHN|nr:hypothetical protein [Altererythrobacter epoxidivorans]ALE16077.1 hypothetical protein AMC99_00774 [Altererythrobacter epoxidivorans]
METTARSVSDIEQWLDSGARAEANHAHAAELLASGEEVLENWLVAHGKIPTNETREGFRLLALHRQGAQGDPSFNACRETCRELAYHYNLVTSEGVDHDVNGTLAMMRLVTKHLTLFVGGKLQEAGIGDFCCSSRSIRTKPTELAQ